MDFSEAVKIILEHEGGFVDHPSDPGGATKFGISQKAYPHLDIHSLTKDEAEEIYHKDYWLSLGIGRLPASIRLLVFDCAVNQGGTRAAMYLQRAIGVEADGVIGDLTLKAIDGIPADFIFDSIARQRLQSYVKHPKWSVFGAGWAKRLLDIVLRSLASK
jgi:lysozyme family protein